MSLSISSVSFIYFFHYRDNNSNNRVCEKSKSSMKKTLIDWSGL